LPHFWDRIVALRAIPGYSASVKTASTADPHRSPAAHDIASLLRERLRAATRRNPRFSLRSFAQQLGIDHSTLSQVLRNKRNLSLRALKSIAQRLGLSEDATRAYAQSKKKPNSKNPPQDIRNLQFDLDTFQLLSVWYHSAILELIQIKDFKPDSRWIAHALGITVEDVNITLQRLLRLGLLEMSARNRWTDKSGDAEFQTAALSEVARNRMNHEIHELAIDSIKRAPTHHRVHRQMIIALDSAKLTRLATLADNFLHDVRSLVSESNSKDDVYQLEISFFPMTTLNNSKGDENG
jgi:uncharacterized protein (TIGR02147 family)